MEYPYNNYGVDNSGLYKMLYGDVAAQVDEAIKPTGPYNSYIENVITPQADTSSSWWDSFTGGVSSAAGGLWDSLQSPGFWQGTGSMLEGVGSIGNIVLGAQTLGLLEDQLSLQQDAWKEQKRELDTMRRSRDNINTSYMA